MPARAIDTATIAFGLVSIPIKIYSTSEPSHEIHFHMIHEGCGERLKQQYICPRHGVVERSEMSKGFELTKGNFVELSKEELKALEAVANDEVSIREFVPAVAIDPIYVERTYYLGPGKGGERAYRLLRDALESAELVGVAAYAARGKEYVVMVRPFEDGLAMHQLRYPDEIKSWSEVPVGRLAKPAAAELSLASQIISQLQHDTFDPTQYSDEVKDRIRKLIAKKAKGGEIVAPPEAPKPVVTDLMEALKASLSGAGKAPAAGSDSSDDEDGDSRRRRARGRKTNGHAARSTKSTTHHARAKNGHARANAKAKPSKKHDASESSARSRGHAHAKTRTTRHAARSHAARSRSSHTSKRAHR